LSGNLLAESIVRGWDRIHRRSGTPLTKADLAASLSDAFAVALSADAEGAAALRKEMAVLLREVDAAKVAIEAAQGDHLLQQILADGFQALGRSFLEFDWLLSDLTIEICQGNARLAEIAARQRQTNELFIGLRQDVLSRMPQPAIHPIIAPDAASNENLEVARPDVVCPYPGLAAFGPDDADAGFFQGREELTATLVSRVAMQAVRGGPLIVLGPSGSGKSSLLRAGLLPALASGAMPIEGSADWPRLCLSPGREPVMEIAAAVCTLAGVSTGGLPAAIRADPSALRAAIRQALVAVASGDIDRSPPRSAAQGGIADGANRIVMIIDQFEELFTHGACSEDQTMVVRALLKACEPLHGESPAVVVLGVRADFYGRCARIPELVPFLQDSHVVVRPMDDRELRRAIDGPAAAAGLTLQPGLADLLLAEASGESLPLVAHALRQTFERRQGMTLTVRGYQATGGIAQAVATTAERMHDGLDEDGRYVLRQMLLRMVSLGDGVEDTRRRVDRDELLGSATRPDVAEGVIARLVEHRLVTAEKIPYVLSHEALLRAWPRLSQWLSDDRDGLRLHRELGDRARIWNRVGRDASSLYAGAELQLAQGWVVHHMDVLDELETDFYEASVAAESARAAAVAADHRARKRRTRLLYAALATLAALLAAALAAGGLAMQQRGAAENARRIALSRQLAAQSASAIDSNPELASLLAVEAYRVAPDRRGEKQSDRRGQSSHQTQSHRSRSRNALRSVQPGQHDCGDRRHRRTDDPLVGRPIRRIHVRRACQPRTPSVCRGSVQPRQQHAGGSDWRAFA
jgi:hypothetical protein